MSERLNLQWVSETIGEDYKQWKKGDVIKIQAQTGTGKTYFIKTKLIDNMEKNENLIYICNRINLKRQLKQDLLAQNGEGIPYVVDDEGNEILDVKSLDKITVIGNVSIVSYQSLQNKMLNAQYGLGKFEMDYDYIVMDEVHYTLTDASFNNKSYLTYEHLIKQEYKNAIKIYMSASMDEVGSVIDNVEMKLFDRDPIEYTTGIDYSYVIPKYFKNMDDIVQLIKNDETNEKWMIFISNKDQGKNIVKEMGEEMSSFIDVKTNKSEELDSIISSSKFEKKVLVTTKVLNNGINISDDKLTNMVIMAWDKTTFIQMLGRKRIDIENPQNVTLYINTRYKKSFSTKIRNYNFKSKEVNLYTEDKNEFNRKYDNDIKKIGEMEDLFYRNQKGEWSLNPVGHSRLLDDRKFASHMVDLFNLLGEFAFIFKQLEWLELENTFDESNLIQNVASSDDSENLKRFLEESHDKGARFDKEVFIESIEKIIKSKTGSSLEELLTKLDGKHKRNKGMKQYNKLFDLLDIPYLVGSKRFKVNGKLETKWIIIKID